MSEARHTDNERETPQEESQPTHEVPPPGAEESPESSDTPAALASEEGEQEPIDQWPGDRLERPGAMPQKDSTRWPPAVALLNLTGLGLGYLFMKRWVRWLIHLLLTVGLFTTAFLTNGARSPKLWVAVFCLWLLWMAFDGWRQARRLARAAPTGSSDRRWLPVAVAVLVLALEAVGLWGYTALGRRAFTQAMDAYRDGDCRTAIQRFHRVTTLYELTLSPNVAAADAGITECSLLVFAENARGKDEYAQAVDGYGTHLSLYPDSLLVVFSRESLAETYGDWASALRQTKKYETAIEKYQVVLSDYPETPTGKKAAGLAAETYAQWAAQLWDEKEYDAAIEKHRVVLGEYPDTPSGKQAAALVAEIYADWAAHLREEGKYEEAIGKYAVILGEYGDTPSSAQASVAKATMA